MVFVVVFIINFRYNGIEILGLGLFSIVNDNKIINYILVVEFDINDSFEVFDISSNYVGIDINSKILVVFVNVSYYNYIEGKNIILLFVSGNSIFIWIDYDGIEKWFNVILVFVLILKLVLLFLLSFIKLRVFFLLKIINILEIFNEIMFVGFLGFIGIFRSD